MGNVAGVGQLLETVGVPAPQVGAQTGAGGNVAPGQDFASALQQAGGPSAPVPSSQGNGQEDANATATAKSGVNPAAGAKITVATPKTAGATKNVTSGQVGRQGVVAGQARVSTTGTLVAAASRRGSTLAEASEVASAETDLASVLEGASKQEEAAVSLSGTVQAKGPVALAGTPPSAITVAPVPAAAVKGMVTAKLGEASGEGSAKAAGKAAPGAAVDIKLTALVPQGSVEVTQGSGMVVAPVPAVAIPLATGGAGNEAAGLSKTVVAAPSAGAVQPVTAQATAGTPRGGEQAADGKSDGMGAVPATPAAASAPAVKVSAGQEESSASGANMGSTRMSDVRAQGPVVAQAVTAVDAVTPKAAMTVPSTDVQAAAGSSGQTSGALQAAAQTSGGAEANSPKQGGHGARSAAVAAKGAATVMGSIPVASAQPAVAEAKAPVAVASGGVPVAGASSAKAHVVVADAKQGGKTAEVAAPLVPGGAPVTTKVADSAEVSTAPVGVAKGADDAVHAAAVPPQPASLTVEPVAVAAAGVPVPVLHEAGAGTTGVGGTAAGAFVSSGTAASDGTHEVGGTAGLSHTTLSTTPTSLEVGVSGGTHGWLKIRAELNAAGEVNASLTGGTPAAAEKLRGELPALSDYLQNEKVSMGTLDVRPALHAVTATGESGASFSQSGSGQGGAGQGSSGQTGSGQANAGGAAVSADAGSQGGRAEQQTPQGGEAISVVSGVGAADEVVLGRASETAVYANSIELGDNAGASSVGYGAGGGWLNVRA